MENNDFSFNHLYPSYSNTNNNNNNNNTNVKDYSQYNGYNSNDICYNCGCLKNQNGNIFCGKEVPGIGIVGCSEKWKCHNCKKCDENYDNTSNKQYECKNCKCHETKAGIMCGQIGRIDGVVRRCNPSCVNCSKCKTSGSSSKNNFNYKTIKTDNKRDNIIINNISKIDIDNLL